MVFSLPLFVHVWYFACNEVHVLSHWYGRRRISVVCVLLFCSFQRSLNVNLFKTNNSNDTTANVLDCNRLECSIKKKLRIWSHLLKKSLMENFIFCAVIESQFAYRMNVNFNKVLYMCINDFGSVRTEWLSVYYEQGEKPGHGKTS